MLAYEYPLETPGRTVVETCAEVCNVRATVCESRKSYGCREIWGLRSVGGVEIDDPPRPVADPQPIAASATVRNAPRD